ncbi:hypothetical protein ACIBJC_05550 [Streptomyces sp. NPDC050509]
MRDILDRWKAAFDGHQLRGLFGHPETVHRAVTALRSRTLV